MSNEEKILATLEKHGAILETLVQGQATMQADIVDLKQGQAKLEQGQAKLEVDITEVKSQVVTIENVHGDKLGRLLDGYKMAYDKACEVNDKLDAVIDDQVTHELYIKKLDRDIKKSS